MFRLLSVVMLFFINFVHADEFSMVFKSLLGEKATLKACRNVQESETTHSKRLDFISGMDDSWTLQLMPGMQLDRVIKFDETHAGKIIALKNSDGHIICEIEINPSKTPVVKKPVDAVDGFCFAIYGNHKGIYQLIIGYDESSITKYILGLRVLGMPQQWSK